VQVKKQMKRRSKLSLPTNLQAEKVLGFIEMEKEAGFL